MTADPTNPPAFHSGFIAVMGRPSAGKSTLMNTILGQKIAAISPRPQTTRRRQLGIHTTDQAQMVFIDTPGLHQPRHKLGEKMVQQALEALADCDLVLFIADAAQEPQPEDRMLAAQIDSQRRLGDTILVLNKIDLIPPETLEERRQAFQALLPQAEVCAVSALQGKGVPELLQRLAERLPEGPLYYPPEQVTDLYEREIAADLVRAAALLHLRDEVPHGIAVRIDTFTERGETGAYIQATLFVERDSHKPIVIGQNGSMLKKIGTTARQEIEAMSERKVYLDLHVKVRKNWRDDENALDRMGFKTSKR